ncbi:MAG: hypothetical protein HY906_03850 [Deltaproteobacteria bacterium]|nr:hypothetical protein [Deltaproteobacteria bacterium]
MVFDVAYAHIFLPQRTVENSNLTAMDFGGVEAGPVVGHGTYRARFDGLYLQLTALYGGVRRPPRPAEAPPLAAPGGPEAEPEPEETLRRRRGEEGEVARRPAAPTTPGRAALAPIFDEESAPRLADPDDAEQIGADRERPRMKRARMERPARVGKASTRPALKAKRGRPPTKPRPRCLQYDSRGRCLLERRWG